MRILTVLILLSLSSTKAIAAVYSYESGLLWQTYSVGPPSSGSYEPVGPLQASRLSIQFEANLAPSSTTTVRDFLVSADPFSLTVMETHVDTNLVTWLVGGSVGEGDVTTDAAGNIVDWSFFVFLGSSDVLAVTSSPNRDSFYYRYEYVFSDPDDAFCSSFCFTTETISARSLSGPGTWTVVPLPASGLVLLSALGLLAMKRRRQPRRVV